jgi:hypothetical protein
MACCQVQDLETWFYRQNYVLGGSLRRPWSFPSFIRIADYDQPQSGFVQMAGNFSCKQASFLLRTE